MQCMCTLEFILSPAVHGHKSDTVRKHYRLAKSAIEHGCFGVVESRALKCIMDTVVTKEEAKIKAAAVAREQAKVAAAPAEQDK